ncbi:MAG: asparagine synthase (glutamine-hydrolyzing) [Phycisphaeraceae bacterium]|nr:asparagine synthase (glutamine-hydrolyzing) [Phycisphaeraceae bacterium]
MCGIAGILRVHPLGSEVPPPDVAIPESWLDVLDESIKHRGPDGQGRFRDRATRPDGSVVDVAFVHRRLAIIDLACGQQPMVSERGPYPEKPRNGRVAVVFNGCIYNHRELRKELQSAGHKFVTDHSDTEVLIHGWREWGLEIHRHLDGMYAFSIWDHASAGIYSAVDLVGEKPLYTFSDWPRHTLCAFASTIPALARFQRAFGITPRADTHPMGFSDLLAYGFLSDDGSLGYTPIELVRRVSPRSPIGIFATRGSVRPEPCNPDPARLPAFSVRNSESPEAINAGNVEDILNRAVESRLRSDVPTGCFLSGGIDSSLMSILAKKLIGELQTFCVRMPRLEYDESPIAGLVAKHIGSVHQTLDCHGDPSGDVIQLIRQLGLPFGDSSLLPTHWVSRAARDAIGVAISGDGGDELFGGYERYRAAQLLQRFASFLRMVPSMTRYRRREKSRMTRIGRLVQAAKEGGYPALLMIFPPSELRQLASFPGRKPWEDDPRGDSVSQAMRFDILNYLPGDLLTKVDTASMAVALEVRAPFLATEIVRRSMMTPVSALMPHGERKGLLKAVARKYLPDEIVDRPKMGFSIPIGEWFRTDYGGMKQLLLDTLNSADPFPEDILGIRINRTFIARMVEDHMDRRRDHSQRLYMLLVLAIWSDWLRGLSGTIRN